MERHPNFPTFWNAVGILVGVVAFQLVIAVLLSGAGQRLARDPGGGVLIAMLSFAAVIAWLVSYKGLAYRRLLHDAGASVQATVAVLALPIFLFAAGATILLIDLDAFVMGMVPPSKQEAELFKRLMQVTIARFLLFCTLAPLLEEMLFRGIFLRSFLPQYGERRAILLSSLLFALLHLNLYQGITAFLVGLFLGWLYARTRSLWPCVMGHAFYNMNAFIWVWATTRDQDLADAPLVEYPDFGVQVLGVALTFAGAAMLRKLLPSPVRV
jgi:uncharacterized protein